MADRKTIDKMILDISTTKQIRQSVIDLNEEELEYDLRNQVEILDNWMNNSKNRSKAQLFSNRTPFCNYTLWEMMLILPNYLLTKIYLSQSPVST